MPPTPRVPVGILLPARGEAQTLSSWHQSESPPRAGLRHLRCLTFHSSSACASAFASAPGPHWRQTTLLLVPGLKGSPASGWDKGRGLPGGGRGVFRERVQGEERSPRVRQGAVQGPGSN